MGDTWHRKIKQSQSSEPDERQKHKQALAKSAYRLKWQDYSFIQKRFLEELSKSTKQFGERCNFYFERELSYGLLFLFVAVFAAIGAIFYFQLATEPAWSKILAGVGLSGGLLYLSRKHRLAWICCGFFLCAVLGLVSAKIETERSATSMLGSDVTTTLTGRIVTIEKMDNRRYRILLDVLDTQKPKLKYGPERIRVTANSMPEGLKPGDGLTGLIRLRAMSGPIRPGAYDFSFHYYFQGIGAQGFYLGKPDKVSVPEPPTFIAKFSQNVALLRMNMTASITEAIKGETGSVAAALITGQRGGITEETNNALRVSGLAHILSISGLHMAMVSGMVLVIIRSILALFPVFSSRFSAKKLAATAALLVAAFYLMLSGADVAAQRSFIMVAVMLLAILCNRSAITMRNLAISALITIIIVPHELLGPSFQMSFSATAALVAAFGWWSDRRKHNMDAQKIVPTFVGAGIVRWAVFPFVSTGVASLVAGVASGIYASYHFSNAAPLGIISNAIAFPVMSIAVMPFALLAAILMPFGLQWFALKIMGFGVGAVIKIAYAIAAISPDINPGIMPPTTMALLTIALVILLFFKTRLRFFSIIFMSGATLIYATYKPPYVLISEDANIVGVLDKKTLFIQQQKTTNFTLKNWQRAYRLTEIIPARNGNDAVDGQNIQSMERMKGFHCDDNSCVINLESKPVVAVVQNWAAFQNACVNAGIIVADTGTYGKNCSNGMKIIVTRKSLALRGSAEINTDGKIIWASHGPFRPWNSYRKHSRSAKQL